MARNFNGTSDYIDCGDIDALDGVSQLSVGVWVKPSSLADFRVVVDKMDAGLTNGFSMQMSGPSFGANNDIILYIHNADAAPYAATTANILAAGVWGRWLFVYDGTQSLPAANRLKFYFNGTAVTLSFGTNPPATIGANTAPLTFGKAASASSNYWPGDLAEPSIWLAALTPAEAAADAKFSAPMIRPASLELSSRLTGRQSPERDIVGGHSLTLTGTAYATHPRVIYPRGVEQVFVPVVAAGGSLLLPHMMEHGLFVGAHGA